MTNIIATRNVLNIIYTISKDKFNKEWIEEAVRKLQNKLENFLVIERQKNEG